MTWLYLNFPPLIPPSSSTLYPIILHLSKSTLINTHPPLIELYQIHRNKHFTVQIRETMASTSAVLAAMPVTSATQKRLPSTDAFFRPLPVRPSKAVVGSKSTRKFEAKASLKEKAVAGLTVAALMASMVVPEVAEAAGSGVSPSLKNFLLSIVAGGVVLSALVGAVIGVANFDPVKRS